LYTGKLSAQRVWQTFELERMLHQVLAMKGKISTRQSFKLLSGVPQEGGIPCTVWNPMSYVHSRVSKKQKVDLDAPNRACLLFEPVDDQFVTANGLASLPYIDVEPVPGGSSDEESDSANDSDAPPPNDEEED